MNPHSPPPPSTRGITIFLVVVLGLQFVAGFKLVSPPRKIAWLAPFRVAESPTLWPFLDYNMYDNSHHEGETTGRPLLFVVYPDGEKVQVAESDFRLPYRRFRDEILWPLRDLPNEQALALAIRTADTWVSLGHLRPRALRVETQTLAITRAGIEERSLELHRVVQTKVPR